MENLPITPTAASGCEEDEEEDGRKKKNDWVIETNLCCHLLAASCRYMALTAYLPQCNCEKMEIKWSNPSLCYTFNKIIHLFSKCASPCSVIAFATPHICCLPAPELNINALSLFFFPSHHIPHNLIIMTNATPQLKAELGDGLRRISIAGNCLRGGAGASVCFRDDAEPRSTATLSCARTLQHFCCPQIFKIFEPRPCALTSQGMTTKITADQE